MAAFASTTRQVVNGTRSEIARFPHPYTAVLSVSANVTHENLARWRMSERVFSVYERIASQISTRHSPGAPALISTATWNAPVGCANLGESDFLTRVTGFVAGKELLSFTCPRKPIGTIGFYVSPASAYKGSVLYRRLFVRKAR